MTQDESGRLFASMAVDTETLWISPERRTAAGLVEQQRLFILSDEHPTRHRRRGELQQRLEEIGLPYCFIGGVAVQRWGEPRLTVGADAMRF